MSGIYTMGQWLLGNTKYHTENNTTNSRKIYSKLFKNKQKTVLCQKGLGYFWLSKDSGIFGYQGNALKDHLLPEFQWYILYATGCTVQ